MIDMALSSPHIIHHKGHIEHIMKMTIIRTIFMLEIIILILEDKTKEIIINIKMPTARIFCLSYNFYLLY
jgi:hypothetical protein